MFLLQSSPLRTLSVHVFLSTLVLSLHDFVYVHWTSSFSNINYTFLISRLCRISPKNLRDMLSVHISQERFQHFCLRPFIFQFLKQSSIFFGFPSAYHIFILHTYHRLQEQKVTLSKRKITVKKEEFLLSSYQLVLQACKLAFSNPG